MRLSTLFGQTQRHGGRYPVEDGRHWLIRGAFMHAADDGIFWLPLGEALRQRVLRRLVDALEGMEVQAVAGMPLQAEQQHLPLAWQSLLEAHIASYRHLPRLLLGHDRRGVYVLALAPSPEAAEEAAQAIHARWEEALRTAGLALTAGEGALWGERPARLSLAEAAGGEAVLRCPACGYHAEATWARRAKPAPSPTPPQPLTPVPTPHANTIRALADFLGVPESQTAKAVFLQTVEDAPRLVFAVVRGDMQVSEAKLARILGVGALKPADEAAIRAAGAVPGYASPVGVRGALVVVDDLIPASPNLVAGANREGYHLTGVNYGRDFQADLVADIVLARAGDPCPHCGTQLEEATAWKAVQSHGIATDAAYLSPEGKPAPLGVAWVYADVEAAIFAAAAQARTETGLAWPPGMAPYDVHLIALRGGEEAAETLYAVLQAGGLRVLYDDRKASPGVKFTDADLMGLPWRITVGKRSLKQGGAEVKPRMGEATLVPLDEVLPTLTPNI